MARSINQIQGIKLTFKLIFHLNRMAFDGNASFAFQVHTIKNLIFLITFIEGMGLLQQLVGQGTFTMVNMGDDTKIPDILHGLQNYNIKAEFLR